MKLKNIISESRLMPLMKYRKMMSNGKNSSQDLSTAWFHICTLWSFQMASLSIAECLLLSGM